MWVTYLPHWQLTLVVVVEGRATLWPVVRFDDRQLGDPIPLEAGEFLYTAPDAMLPEISGLLESAPLREPRPLNGLRPFIRKLGIEPWLGKVQDRAKLDSIPLDLGPLGEPPLTSLSLVLAGGPLENAHAQEAVLHAVPWAGMTKELFPDGEVRVAVKLRGEEIDARRVPHDLDQAREFLAAAGLPDGFELRLLYPQEDQRLATMAERMIQSLGEAGIKALLEPVPAGEAWPRMQALAAAGQAVLLMGSQT